MHKTNREIEVVRSIVVDKIASVAIDTVIGREIRISPDIPCEEGILIAVEILNNKSRYNTLELTSGRMAQVKQGDVIGTVGSTGRSTGAHLDVRLNWFQTRLDPATVLDIGN